MKQISNRGFCDAKRWIDDIITNNIVLSNDHENNWQIATATNLLIIEPCHYLIIQSSWNIVSIPLFRFGAKESIS